MEDHKADSWLIYYDYNKLRDEKRRGEASKSGDEEEIHGTHMTNQQGARENHLLFLLLLVRVGRE